MCVTFEPCLLIRFAIDSNLEKVEGRSSRVRYWNKRTKNYKREKTFERRKNFRRGIRQILWWKYKGNCQKTQRWNLRHSSTVENSSCEWCCFCLGNWRIERRLWMLSLHLQRSNNRPQTHTKMSPTCWICIKDVWRRAKKLRHNGKRTVCRPRGAA